VKRRPFRVGQQLGGQPQRLARVAHFGGQYAMPVEHSSHRADKRRRGVTIRSDVLQQEAQTDRSAG
jgi:hypothetical protein